MGPHHPITTYLRPVTALRHLLWPFALLYGAAVRLRNLLFDVGVWRSERFDVPVISVGNLEAGGTGKSPLVLHICGHLLARDMRVAMLSRGYGRRSTGFVLAEEHSGTADVGDEPLQAKLRFPVLTVAVCENRAQGIRRLLSMDPRPEVIVLDDAFQHRWVAPSLSILTTPSARPFWRGHLLPVGTLREGSDGASRAQVLVLTGEGGTEGEVPFAGPVFRMKMGITAVRPVNGTPELQDGDRVLLCSGIANPDRFRATVESRFEVAGHLIHPDHHVFSRADILALRDAFHSFGPSVKGIIITGKDAARLHRGPHRDIIEPLPLHMLIISSVWHGTDGEDFNRIIDEHVGTDKRDR